MTKQWIPALLASALVGCSADNAITDASDDRSYDSGASPEMDDAFNWAENGGLTLNVFPPALGEGSDYLPQSFTVSDTAVGDLTLAASVTWSGSVTGSSLEPWASPELPGESGGVSGSVRVWRPSTVQDRRVQTDPETGGFSMLVVPGDDLRVAVVPDAASTPFLTSALMLASDDSAVIDLGAGTALYGRVETASGSPIAGARVFATDEHGTSGPVARADAEGVYQLRVTEGRHRVTSLGGDSGREPTVRSGWIEVPSHGASADLMYASLQLETVGGRVLNEFGDPADNVAVRLSSVALDGYNADASHQVQVRTNAQGIFDTRVVRGVWAVEVLAEQGQAASPVDVGEVEVAATVELGAIYLPPLQAVQGRVTDPSGSPVANVSVRATELGFASRSFTTSTDGAGLFQTSLPDVPLEFVLVPPAGRPDVALTRVGGQPGPQGNIALELDPGQPYTGRITVQDGVRLDPVSGALVELRDIDDRLWGVGATAADGRWSLSLTTNR